MQFLVACAGIVVAIGATVLAYKLVRAIVRSIVGTYRSITGGVRNKYRWVMRRRIIMLMKGKFMAKMKIRKMADAFEEIIFANELSGFLSDHEGRKLRHKMAEVLGTRHIAPRPIGRKLRRYFFGETFVDAKGVEHFVPPTYEKLAGPKQPMAAGGPPGAVTAPNVISSAALDKFRQKKAG